MIANCLKALIGIMFVFVFLLASYRQDFAKTLKINNQVVSISRDQFGIPTIQAPSFSSAMYAWGYATAEDRLFQMSFRRMLGKGRLSQLVGEKGIKIDKMFKELNFYGWSQKTQERFKQENATEYENFRLYAKGINDYVATLSLYPIEFYMLGMGWEQWTVTDMVNLFKLLKWSQSQNAAQEYIRSSLLKNFTKEEIDQILSFEGKYWMKGQFATQETIIKDHEIKEQKIIKLKPWEPQQVKEMLKVGFFQYIDTNQRGSNSWVIGGKYTQSGHPLIANDPHLDSALPGEWHQVRIYYKKNGKQYKIIGGAMTGLPCFIGKTSYGAIAITTTYSDSQDLYKQTINDKQEYLLDGEWRKLIKRTQTIKVKGGQDIEYSTYETHRGPLIKYFAHASVFYEIDEDISLCWAGFTDVEWRSLIEYAHIAQIQNFTGISEFIADISDYGPSMNFLFITNDDHFGYQSVGTHPIRQHPHHGMYVKDGSTTQYDWKGFLKKRQKLGLVDPERGYIVTANNKPSSIFQNGIFDISILTARADRLEQMVKEQIKSGKKFTKDDMKRMQMDTTDVYCLEVVKEMKKKVSVDKARFGKVFEDFIDFDCNFSEQSTKSTIFVVFFRQLYNQLYPGQNKVYNLGIVHPYLQYVFKFILEAETGDELNKLQRSLDKTYQILKDFFKTSDKSKYIYSKFHKDMMVHRPFSQSNFLKPFFERVNPGWGNWNTPNVAKLNKFHDEDYGTYHRANIRTIMSYFEDSQWIVDGGVSEKFFSKHYQDQTELFLKNEYLLMDPSKNKQKEKNEEL